MVQEDTSKMIRRLRAAFGLTQEQFAAKIGVTFSTINRWENDKGKPSPLAMLNIKKLQKRLKQNKQSKQAFRED
jgi:transcriptional regulator with XRE-family HTH domain